MSTGWIVLGVIVVLVLFAFGAYNRLVALSQRVGQAFADIDVQLKQRHDLIPNLLETVKGYAAHERGTLDDVVKARNAAMQAQGPGQVAAAENQLSGALGKLIALSEAYPDLKANANFQQLATELSDLENKIAASRQPPLLQQRGPGIQYRHPADAGRAVCGNLRLHPQGVLRSRRRPDRNRGGADGEILIPTMFRHCERSEAIEGSKSWIASSQALLAMTTY
jgi:LemA protein